MPQKYGHSFFGKLSAIYSRPAKPMQPSESEEFKLDDAKATSRPEPQTTRMSSNAR